MSKKNYRLTIGYDGSRYQGWEHQPGTDMTIQGKIENVLALMLGFEEGRVPEVIGSGRTDAGVHAEAMIANTIMDTPMKENEIRDYLNRYLPDDICVRNVSECSPRFHSRYNATGKTYRYTCYVGDTKPLFDRKYVYVPDGIPDIERMREAAKYLVGEHDFASYCAHAGKKKSTVREIYSIDINRKNDRITFIYHGSGFLQYMVRILTGTLLEVGLGKRDPDSIPRLTECRDRTQAGFTAPACGLCMVKVDYE